MKKVYGRFCSRHNEAVNYYKELHAKDKRFQAFIKVGFTVEPVGFKFRQMSNNFVFSPFLCYIYIYIYICVCVPYFIPEKDEQCDCSEAEHSRVYLTGHAAHHQIPCAHPENTAAHKR